MILGENKKIITRFAPSPTGFMHVGGVRTALFSYLWAKKNNGTFILRIEDTDKAREVDGSIEHIMESLKWLGIDWDQGPDNGGPYAPYKQSDRLEIYNKYAQKLIDAGYAYVDPHTEEEIELLRQEADKNKVPFLYREHRALETNIPWTGVGQTLRFRVKDIKRYVWNDIVYGELSAGTEALDDFVLIKADGYPTYNFAHVIDDIEMGVTHVMRGQEFVSSTPKYLSLYDALGAIPPIFVSLPHIMADCGKKKLGKRDGAKDILDYREEGYLPEALFNFLAFLGWNPGGEVEIMSHDELINAFDITRLQKGGAQFDDVKLNWYNREHIKRLSDAEFIKRISGFLPDHVKQNPEILNKIIYIIRDHIDKLGDVKDLFIAGGELDFFFTTPVYEKSLLISPKTKLGNTAGEKVEEFLQGVKDILSGIDELNWDMEFIKGKIMPYADQNGRGDVLWAMRVALTGLAKSPDPFTSAFVLGKTETLSRL